METLDTSNEHLNKYIVLVTEDAPNEQLNKYIVLVTLNAPNEQLNKYNGENSGHFQWTLPQMQYGGYSRRFKRTFKQM